MQQTSIFIKRALTRVIKYSIFSVLFKALNMTFEKRSECNLTKQNVRNAIPMKDETSKSLIEYYKPYNEKLFHLINKKFDWDK